jgi:RNA polymerase sigma-70 factor (family 1)
LDKEDFKILFETHYKSIRYFLYYKSGDEKMAEDLAQDVFYTIWEKRETIRLETVKPLLYKISLNLLISKDRRKKIEYNFQNSLISNIMTESPQYLMEFEEFKNRFQDVLASLPDKQRIVFLMNRIEGLTYSKIAENLSISNKSVEKRMKLALSKIEKAIKFRV